MKIDRWEIYWGLLQNQAEEKGRFGQKERFDADTISTKTAEGPFKVVLSWDKGPEPLHPSLTCHYMQAVPGKEE